MRLAVLGASGRVGRVIVERAIAAGHEVTAFVRDPASPPAGAHVVQGDLADADAVDRAVAGADAVLSAVGPTRGMRSDPGALASGMATVVAAMKRHGVRRLVALSGAGITVECERKRPADRIASAVVKLFAGWVVESKQREYAAIRDSGLDWVIVRAPRIRNGSPSGRLRAGDVAIGPLSSVDVQDLADFMLQQTADERFVRGAPFVVS